MATNWSCAALGIALVVASGCGSPGSPVAGGAGASDFRPTTTIKDIMTDVIDPSADAIWESVVTVIDFDGTHEHYPRTDEEWAEVRGHAIRVLEASNLLVIPGRRVAEPGASSEFPEVELAPDEIQALIDDDWRTFVNYAHGLHDAALETLKAVDARDKDALLALGNDLDRACERCHLHYWYPDDSAARSLFEQNERLAAEEASRRGASQ